MVRALFLLAVIGLGEPARAESAFLNGHQLHLLCNSSEAQNLGDCFGYVTGVADLWMGVGESLDGSRFPRACVPPEATREQIRDVVAGFLNEVPQARHLSARALVLASLANVFPCPVRPGAVQ